MSWDELGWVGVGWDELGWDRKILLNFGGGVVGEEGCGEVGKVDVTWRVGEKNTDSTKKI